MLYANNPPHVGSPPSVRRYGWSMRQPSKVNFVAFGVKADVQRQEVTRSTANSTNSLLLERNRPCAQRLKVIRISDQFLRVGNRPLRSLAYRANLSWAPFHITAASIHAGTVCVLDFPDTRAFRIIFSYTQPFYGSAKCLTPPSHRAPSRR